MPYVIEVSTNLLAWSASYTNLAGGNMVWVDPAPRTIRRFYRTLTPPGAPVNPQEWTAVSDWLRASGSPMYYTTTSASQGVRVFRVQVRP
jgi:hypothetical protein